MLGQRSGLNLVSALLCAALSVAFPLAAARGETRVRIGGNGSGLGALKLLAQAYHKEHPGVTVSVVPNLGSAGGIAALRQGALDLAVSARALKAEEQADGAQAVEYARTPFVFVTHAKVDKTGVNEYELIGILHQEAPTWPNGTRIRLILRPENDADSAIIRQISPEMARAFQKAASRPGMVLAVTDSESLDASARMPGALGGAALTQILTERRPVRVLTYNGVEPTLKNLGTGRYPLVKRYYLVTTRKTSAAARDFASFVRSPRAREILRRTGNLTPLDGKER